jgi:GntR family transcriptional regulator
VIAGWSNQGGTLRVMPLLITPGTVSRVDGRPLHRQLSDFVRAEIAAGHLTPGEHLPSEREIAEASGLSVTAVRDALAGLASDGTIVKRSGRPSQVALPPPVRNLATSRYADELSLLQRLQPGEPHPETSAFTNDHGIGWSDYSVQAEYVEDVATDTDTRLLMLPAGAAVLRRQIVKVVRGIPAQVQESVIPLELVRGTPVADPGRQPWPGGTIAELWSVGLRVTAVHEEARARTPSVSERRTLDMTAPGPVFDIVRVFSADHMATVAVGGASQPGWPRPVEASSVVIPAAGLVLRWETDLSDIDLWG